MKTYEHICEICENSEICEIMFLVVMYRCESWTIKKAEC